MWWWHSRHSILRADRSWIWTCLGNLGATIATSSSLSHSCCGDLITFAFLSMISSSVDAFLQQGHVCSSFSANHLVIHFMWYSWEQESSTFPVSFVILVRQIEQSILRLLKTFGFIFHFFLITLRQFPTTKLQHLLKVPAPPKYTVLVFPVHFVIKKLDRHRLITSVSSKKGILLCLEMC